MGVILTTYDTWDDPPSKALDRLKGVESWKDRMARIEATKPYQVGQFLW